jgi:hypothetical protein
MRWPIACLLAAACGGKPPPKHAAAQLPVEGTRSLTGTWLTNDDMDWGYRLVLVPDGRFAMLVDRGKMGHCDQKGRLVQGDGPTTFILTLTKDSCSDSGAAGGSLTVSIPSLTDEAMTLMYRVGDAEVRRVYTRDPNVARTRTQ